MTSPQESATPTPWPTRVVRWSLAFALLGAAWAVDPWASAAFDAPKRAAVLFGTGIAFLAFVWNLPRPAWRRWSSAARVIVVLALLAACGIALSACLAPPANTTGDALRTLLLYALLLPLGASTAVAASRRWLLAVAALGIGSNAVLSLLQAGGLGRLPIAQLGGRFASGALLGNEGYVALACALLGAAACAVLLNGATPRVRALAASVGALAVAVIAINQQLTAASALATAVAVMLAIRWRLRWLVPVGAAALCMAVLCAALPPLRAATWGAAADVATYQRLSTSRIAAWAAADGMVRDRPLLGIGPGGYAARAQTYRLDAELRLHERLAPPVTAAGFVFAHNDYLQLAAETGLPVMVACCAALALLLARLFARATAPGAVEPLLLLGVLTAGAIAALAWFPLQIPLTAALLLLACGRAWRLVAEGDA